MVSPDLTVVVQRVVDDEHVPDDSEFADWASQVLAPRTGELVVRIVGSQESAALNQRFRGRSGPTNVLAFAGPERPSGQGAESGWPLGDIVLCRELVAAEARAVERPERARWAHLVVHGCLHLLGFDHEEDVQALAMEARETEILDLLGFPDPYSPGTMARDSLQE